ncbi:MAG TPA: TonB-dependent receptor, partial [Candidatus Acidoferrales bacterium]|nr:TonB-dependent receptor [Candidatus Acidoferrales bacterium]
MQTTDASVTTHIDQKQLQDLPIANRQPSSMLSLEPGVGSNGKTSTVINGQRAAYTSVTLDGINIQDNFIRTNDIDFSPNQLFLSQTSEFSVNTQNGDPSVGGGASAVSVVSPRGTNAWHGQGFWYYQSNKWAANPWFNNANGVANAALNQNQYGGQGGGPLIKDKLFVSGSYEELKDVQTSLQDATIFTSPAAAGGTFKYVTSCNNQPGGIPCPAGVNPGDVETVNLLSLENTARSGASPVFTVDPAIATLISRIPANAVVNNFDVGDSPGPNQLLNTAGFSFNARSNAILRNVGGRADYILSAHHSFTATYYRNRQIFDRPDIDTSFNTVPIVSNFDAINFFSTAWRWSPNANFTNEVRFGFDLAPATFDTSQKFGSSFINTLVPGGTTTNDLAFTNPDPNFFFQGRDTHTWSYQDNANWLHGNHSIIAGVQLQRVTIDEFNAVNTSTDFAVGFSTANSFALTSGDFAGVAPISTNDLADANSLLATFGGFVGQTSKRFNVTSPSSGFVPGAPNERNLRQNDWAFYAGDSWRFRPNLTLTYGMRYEYLSPFNELNGLMLEPIPGIGQSMEQALLSNATVGFVGGNSGRRPYNKDLHDFGPNFGIAWDPFGDGKMAVRAGYSIHYVNDDLGTAIIDAVNSNPGLASTVTNIGVAATISGDNGLPAASLITPPAFNIPVTFSENEANLGIAGNTGFGISPGLRTPYVQDWNLSIQRAIGWKTTVTVSYLGNHGTGLIRGLDLNQVIINQNDFLSSFKVARNNCFASIAANGKCDPTFAGAGSEPFPADNVFATLPNDRFTSGTIQNLIETGQVGELANTYHTLGDVNNSGLPFPQGQFTPNNLILRGGLLENFSSSSYNAGVAQVQRRLSNDLIFQGSYTYSKVLDDFDGSQSNSFALLDNADPRLERARANFDITHAVKANFSYTLPFGKGHMFGNNKVVDKVAGGWVVASILTWQSGAPFSFYTGTAGTNGRGTLNRASNSGNETAFVGLSRTQLRDAINLSFPSTGPVLLINPSFIGGNGRGAGPDGLSCSPLVGNGFCNPQPGEVGNLARNEFNGPMFFDQDLSIIKRMSLRESMSLELRGDAFNVFNHPTFNFRDQ